MHFSFSHKQILRFIDGTVDIFEKNRVAQEDFSAFRENGPDGCFMDFEQLQENLSNLPNLDYWRLGGTCRQAFHRWHSPRPPQRLDISPATGNNTCMVFVGHVLLRNAKKKAAQ